MSPSPEQSATRDPGGYGPLSRLFHWAVTALLIVTIPVGIAMTSEGFSSMGDALYVTHKNVGVIIGVLVVLRLLWRVVGSSPPEMPGAIPDRERRLAHATHLGLYALLLAMAATGYLRVVSGDFPVELLDALGVPPLISGRGDLSTTLSVVHKFLAWALVITASLHVGAVLHHTVIEKNQVLRRMWPPWGSRSEPS